MLCIYVFIFIEPKNGLNNWVIVTRISNSFADWIKCILLTFVINPIHLIFSWRTSHLGFLSTAFFAPTNNSFEIVLCFANISQYSFGSSSILHFIILFLNLWMWILWTLKIKCVVGFCLSLVRYFSLLLNYLKTLCWKTN